ncbi:multicopper oxidase CueO [Pokkaliibacter sp. CJK22405]|uniref:multicopper oxidase CueO n=1 Tax=Pokkaliibacter sp. CJK22405 TaxID=3384615 RepID=UPI003984A4CB
MKRRQFLFSTLTLSVAGVMGVSLPGRTLAADAGAVGQPLPVPPQLKANDQGKIVLKAQSGQSYFTDKPTTTFGYNGSLLGPALKFKRGETVRLRVENALEEETTFHLHGLAIEGGADGGPHAMMAPGDAWETEFVVDQPAATCWYHPHSHGRNGYQVAMGLAGLVVIEDDDTASLALPSRWGVDDIPLVIQDKRLNDNAEIDYQLDVMTAAVGWFGDLPLVNGVKSPVHQAPKGWVRLRLLNGSNARSLRLGLSDQSPMQVIASDGGLLPTPVALTELTLMPGERFEVMVNLSSSLALQSLPVDQMGMTLEPFDQPFPLVTLQVDNRIPVSKAKLPTHLTSIPALPDTDALARIPERHFQLSMNPMLDHQGMMALMERFGHKAMGSMPMDSAMDGAMEGGMDMGSMKSAALDLSKGNLINGRAFAMNRIDASVPQGQYERWVISGKGDMMLHPFHIHGLQFRILSENGKAPAAHRSGWKDMVRVEGGVSEVLVKFDHEATAKQPYMAHCHLLEHEDTGMMMAFTVA